MSSSSYQVYIQDLLLINYMSRFKSWPSGYMDVHFFVFFKNLLCTAYRKDNDSKYANDKNCLPDID